MSAGLRIAEGQHTKTPDEINSFSLDYSPHLGDGETLSSVVTQTVKSDGVSGAPALAVDSTNIGTDSISVSLSGGVDGGLYFVVTKMLTNLGQQIEGAVRVVVQNAVEAP